MTKDELEQMSDNELLALLKKKKNDVAKYNVMQLGLKVTLNSAYGMIGNEYSRYFDTRIAEGITVSGQLSIRWIERKLDEYLNKICGTKGKSFAVAGDTDSIYISLAPLVEKFFPDASKEKIVAALDKICEEKIQPIIDAAYAELADYMNAFEQKMFMAREVIADRGLWRAKKNYALNVWNSEGVAYDEPKLKIMGIESTRSSTPEVCRNGIKDTIKLIMTAEEADVQAYIKDFKKKFFALPIEDISRNSGVKDITKWNIEQPKRNMSLISQFTVDMGDDDGFIDDDDDFDTEEYTDLNNSECDFEDRRVTEDAKLKAMQEWMEPAQAKFKSGTPYHVKGAMVYNRAIKDKDLTSKYRTIHNGDKVKLVYLKKANPVHNNTIAFPDVLPEELGIHKFVDKNKQYTKNYLDPVESLIGLIGWTSEKRNTLW